MPNGPSGGSVFRSLLLPRPVRLAALAAAVAFFAGHPAFSATTGNDAIGPAPLPEAQPFDLNSVPPYLGEGDEQGAAPPVFDAPAGPVTVHRETSSLPAPVAALRDALMKAARTGDAEKLGPIFASQPAQPQLGYDVVPDPVAYLKESSNDGAGREPMAIMLEILEAPYAVYDEGKPDAIYVWPYLVAKDLNTLTPEELIDLYRIISYQDYQDMLQYGGWFFYRLGIDARGNWLYFSAGE
ncbi:MAG TPA: hypothetical protein VIL84_09970 [Devosiaceae bacterium]